MVGTRDLPFLKTSAPLVVVSLEHLSHLLSIMISFHLSILAVLPLLRETQTGQATCIRVYTQKTTQVRCPFTSCLQTTRADVRDRLRGDNDSSGRVPR